MIQKPSQSKAVVPCIISCEKNWVEGEALRQLERAAGLAGMTEVVGLPDLQPGKGYPVGAVFISRGRIYPYLIGNDIGCGVVLWQTNLPPKKLKFDRLRKRIDGDGWYDEQGGNEGKPLNLEPTPFDDQLGSMGGGNHFAEIQTVEKIMLPECFAGLGLSKDRLMLLVHSGSRGLGDLILRRHVDQYRDQGLSADSPEAADYIQAHNQALAWAKENRERIAALTLGCLGTDGEPILDLPHNYISREMFNDENHWFHRKGAVAARGGVTVVPGSRGTLTYLVRPVGDLSQTLFSLPHGAGRKWQRGDCRGKLENRYRPEDLFRTELGGHVFCQDKDLLYEEAPQAYKDIATVIEALLSAGVIEVVATFKPLVTIKRGKGICHG